MQQFITVRVTTVVECSHSDLPSYKNLPQSDCRDSELLQQEATAAAEEEETLTQTTEHRADRSLTKHTLKVIFLKIKKNWNKCESCFTFCLNILSFSLHVQEEVK